MRGWERNPNTWLGTASYAVFQLINRDFAPLDQRMRSTVSRMKQIPAVFATAQATLQNPPKLWTEIALMQAQGTRGLYAETLPKAFEPVKDAALQEAFKQEQARCLAAIDGFIRFLREDLLPRSNGDFAIGEPIYRQKLQYEEGVTEDIDSLLAWGTAELARTQDQFREVAARLAPGKDAHGRLPRAGQGAPHSGRAGPHHARHAGGDPPVPRGQAPHHRPERGPRPGGRDARLQPGALLRQHEHARPLRDARHGGLLLRDAAGPHVERRADRAAHELLQPLRAAARLHPRGLPRPLRAVPLDEPPGELEGAQDAGLAAPSARAGGSTPSR